MPSKSIFSPRRPLDPIDDEREISSRWLPLKHIKVHRNQFQLAFFMKLKSINVDCVMLIVAFHSSPLRSLSMHCRDRRLLSQSRCTWRAAWRMRSVCFDIARVRWHLALGAWRVVKRTESSTQLYKRVSGLFSLAAAENERTTHFKYHFVE